MYYSILMTKNSCITKPSNSASAIIFYIIKYVISCGYINKSSKSKASPHEDFPLLSRGIS